MENDDAWGRWYDKNEENERMTQSNLDFAHKQGYKEGYHEWLAETTVMKTEFNATDTLAAGISIDHNYSLYVWINDTVTI